MADASDKKMNTLSDIEFSLVVPCYNEEEALPYFLKEVLPLLREVFADDWELIIVDDGSRDQTKNLVALSHADTPQVKGLFLSRNFGHQAAVNAGLAFASGRFVGVIDCDLQDPIHVLIDMYRECKQGTDVCYGVRQNREASLFLKIAYFLFYYLMGKTSKHSWSRDAGDFCVLSRKALHTLMLLPERSRMLRGLRSWIGFSQKGFPYDRPRRSHGQSKYTLRKLVDLALLGFVGFSDTPLRLIGFSGIVVGVLSFLLMIAVFLNRIFPDFSLLGYWVGASPMAATILVVFLFFMSLMFIFLGIIGEYIRVLLQEVKGRPVAVVGWTVGELPVSNLSSIISASFHRN